MCTHISPGDRGGLGALRIWTKNAFWGIAWRTELRMNWFSSLVVGFSTGLQEAVFLNEQTLGVMVCSQVWKVVSECNKERRLWAGVWRGISSDRFWGADSWKQETIIYIHLWSILMKGVLSELYHWDIATMRKYIIWCRTTFFSDSLWTFIMKCFDTNLI